MDDPRMGPEEEISLIPEPLPATVPIEQPTPAYYDCPGDYSALLPVKEEFEEFIHFVTEAT